MTSHATCFPAELLIQICSTLPQPSLHACTLTSRSWYNAAESFLYAHPWIDGRNFDAFAASVCPPKNASARQNDLAELVRTLDMSGLVHNSRQSLTARMIRRLKRNLEKFVAPQTSFTVNSVIALSKCARLRTLDLSLVSGTIPISKIFDTVSQLPSLRTLHITKDFYEPFRGHDTMPTSRPDGRLPYPPNLKHLHLNGSIYLSGLRILAAIPDTLTHLTIAHADNLVTSDIHEFLSILPLNARLTHLTLGPNVRHCTRASDPFHDDTPRSSLWGYHPIVLPFLPSLTNLTADVDVMAWEPLFPGEWATGNILDCTGRGSDAIGFHYNPSLCATITATGVEITPNPHPWSSGQLPALQTLTMFSASGVQPPFSPQDIWDAIDRNEFPRLRTLRVGPEIEWFGEESGDPSHEKKRVWGAEKGRDIRRDLRDLDDLLQALAREDGSEGGVSEARAGIFKVRQLG